MATLTFFTITALIISICALFIVLFIIRGFRNARNHQELQLDILKSQHEKLKNEVYTDAIELSSLSSNINKYNEYNTSTIDGLLSCNVELLKRVEAIEAACKKNNDMFKNIDKQLDDLKPHINEVNNFLSAQSAHCSGNCSVA